MPCVHSVSEIKVMLSGILGSHDELKNIKVRGKISPLKSTYFLSDGEIGIGCFIPPFIKTQSAQLLIPETPVIVQGNITLYTDPEFNEYEINVNNITSDADEIVAFSMSEVEKQLLKIIADRFEPIDVRARGRINRVGGLPDNVLSLKDPDGSAILCQLHNNKLPNQDREEVFVQGKICNFSAKNRIQYRIDVAEVEPCPPDESIGQCQCSGCESCRSRRDNQSCLPLQNLEYELCANCYHESPDREDRVVQAVYTYFDALGGNGFSPQKARQIQMGSANREADVALVDENGSFAAIAECKGAGYVGHGIEQLKSYLSATDTRFGIFANKADRGQWEFYENRRRNRFDKINRPEFEAGVVERKTTRERLKDEIKALEKAKDDLGDKKFELEAEIAQLMQTERDQQGAHKQLISEIGKKRVQQGELETEIGKLAKTEYDLQDTHKQLRKEIEATTQQHAGLKQEITELRNQKLGLKTEIGHLEQKDHELRASREQWKEKIQQFEILFNDLKSALLDSESPPRSENNVEPQRIGKEKKPGIVSKLKNLFSKEK